MSRLSLALHVLLHGRPPAPAVQPEPQPVPPPGHQQPGPRPEPAPRPEAPRGGLPDTATDRVIDLRDNVLLAAEDDPAAAPALGSVARQLADVLRLSGVEVFDDTGPFDDLRHHAAGTVPASDPALDGTIAESLRSGCARDGTVLRRQQVLVYEAGAGDG